jgi:hypothetical protein
MALRFYETFGLVLQSDFEFPDMEETDRRDVDITIRRTTLSEPCQARDFEWQTQDIGPMVQTFVWKTLGTYRVSDGSIIDIDPVEDVSAKYLSIPLFGAVLATLLHMRGMLVLHASAVVRDGKCVIFMGDKEAGKSTTAFAMIESGYQLLSDDVVAIIFDAEGHPQVMPAFNQVKLLDDAARKFGLDLEAAEQIHPLVEKRRHQTRGTFHQEPARATAFYLLDRDKKGAILPYPPDEALKALIAHSYASRFGRDAFPAKIAIQHMHACARLINSAFVGKLVVPDELAHIEEAVSLVNERLTASATSRTEPEFES